MKTLRRVTKSLRPWWLLVALLGVAAGPCVEKNKLAHRFSGFAVTITKVEGAASGTGTLTDPYVYPESSVTLVFDAVALDERKEVMEDFEREVALQVTPGELQNPTQKVQFVQGKVEQARVPVRKLFGQVALWLEDTRWEKAEDAVLDGVAQSKPDETSTFIAGTSNVLYFKNPTLRQIQWDPQLEPSGLNDTASLSKVYAEINTRINDPQGFWQDGHGQLVVTGVFNEGFFATDLADLGKGYEHLYLYNYSYPDELEVGDRLDRLVGSLQEFSGCTQASFPAWTRATDEAMDPLPFRIADLDVLLPPTVITTQMCQSNDTEATLHLCGYSKKNWELERLESARVRIENVRAPDVYLNCDFNTDRSITSSYPAPDEETTCAAACLKHDGKTVITVRNWVASEETLQKIAVQTCTAGTQCPSGQCGGYSDDDPGKGVCRVQCPWESVVAGGRLGCLQVKIGPDHICAEHATLQQYGQWVVALDRGQGPLINVITREALVAYDPSAPEHLGIDIPFFQGNLRQVRAARPRWMLLVGTLPGDVPPSLNQENSK